MRRLILSSLLLLSVPLAEAAAEYKIATVDINKILNESSEAKEKRKMFEQKAADTRKKLDAKKASLVAMEQRLKDQKVAETSKEAENFRTEARNFERMVRDSDEDMRKEFFKVNKALTEKALKLVNDYASSNKIDLVLDSGDRARGALIFGDPALDVTDQIIKTMGKK